MFHLKFALVASCFVALSSNATSHWPIDEVSSVKPARSHGSNPPNGMIVHLIGEKPDGGWVQIDRGETSGGETPFAGSGWVSGNMLAVSAKNSDGKGAKLYRFNDTKSDVIATVPHRTQVTISGCDRKWLRVKYKETIGWLAADSQCANPAGRCD